MKAGRLKQARAALMRVAIVLGSGCSALGEREAQPAPIATSAGAEPTSVSRACALPTTFRWTSSGPLASPKSTSGHELISLKDFTCVRWHDLYHVYATVYDHTASTWSMVYFNFGDWAQAEAAEQLDMQRTPTRGGVAPQLFYFTPKKKWVLVYQWPASFSISDDPAQPAMWSPRSPLLTDPPKDGLDYTMICNLDSCYLFFAADNGKIYLSKMPIDQFPGAFSGYTTLMSDSQNALYESPRVYSIMGAEQYLMIVEAIGAGGSRYFRSFVAESLDGPWAPLAASEAMPFAGKANVTFVDGAWTDDISHGDIVRSDPAETMPVDPCRMQLVYQGFDKTSHASEYAFIPYRMALLTLAR